jgi:membrane fusion protein (multidrug efflux system)
MIRLAHLFLVLIFVLQFSCKTQKKENAGVKPVDVTTFTVEAKTIPAIFEFVGFADSIHPVEIRARVEGYLDKIAYAEGQLVHEGDLLFQLDPKQYQALVEQAKAEVARQEAIVANAVLTVNRLTPLYQQKAASKKDLDNATASQLASQASLLAAKAQLLNNEINLGYTTILSPITGFADKAKFREGALINPGSNSLLTTVSVLDPIWVYFNVSDNEILRAKGQEADHQLTLPESKDSLIVPKDNAYEVEIIFSDGSVFPYKGTVDFSSPTYDRSTGTLQVRAVFPNPKAELRPGQFMKVKVYGAQRPNALFVPQRALMQKKGGKFVYLINAENILVEQDVSTGDWYDDYQIVTNGLKPGDRIVVDGINKVRAGTLVQSIGEWSPSTAGNKK